MTGQQQWVSGLELGSGVLLCKLRIAADVPAEVDWLLQELGWID